VSTLALLPPNYSAACMALEECERVDECQTWANKASALASYARQSKDETLKNLALRIQARAVRRCGEILKATDNRGAAANAAGITRLQRIQATAVAQIPARRFDGLVDSANPPRVYQLAQIGTRKRGTRELSRTNKARAADLRNEIKRLEARRTDLAAKLEATLVQINQAKRDLDRLTEAA
jgi:hypothetical protein